MRFDMLRHRWHELMGRNTAGRPRQEARRRGRFETLEDRLLLTAAPTGVDYQISTGESGYDQVGPAVDIAANGDFVVAWTATVTDYVVTTPVTHTVPVYRRYSATGTAQDESQVEVYNNLLNQYDVDVAVDEDGDFVIVWTDEDSAGDTDIYFACYSADGTLVRDATRANTTSVDTTNQSDAAVAMADNGDFVITWTHIGTNGTSDIYYRRYSAGGTPKTNGSDGNATSDVMIANAGNNNRTQSDVALGPTGNTIIVWTQQGDTYTDVYCEALRGTDGSQYLGVTRVNAVSQSTNQANPSVDIDARGYFSVAWTDETASNNHDIRLRRFNSAGALRSDAILASTTADETTPQIATAAGQYVVTWQSSDSVLRQTLYQVFGDDNSPRQAVSTLNSSYATDAVSMAIDPAGEFAIVVEHPTSANSLIEGINYRNLNATVGLYNADAAMYLLRNSNTSGEADQVFSFTTQLAGLVAVSGDWDGDGVATVGLYNQETATFYLTNSATAAVAEITFGFGVPNANFVPLAGDWNDDGIDTIGAYDPTTSTFYLRNSNSSGMADIIVAFGPPNLGWTPIVGDWDGTGGDTVGLYYSFAATFFLRNSNTTGAPDLIVAYGMADGTQLPVIGDWNNDGTDTIGVYDPAASVFYLRNANTTGNADAAVAFGPEFGGWTPLANHWQAGSADTICLYDASNTTFYKRYTNTPGFANLTQPFSPASAVWQPVVGDWNYDGVTTIGLYDAEDSMFYLRNTNTDNSTTITLTFSGDFSANVVAISGDWDGDGVVTVGLYDPDTSTFYLRNSNTSGEASVTVSFGAAGMGWEPVIGDWNGNGVDTIGVYDPVNSVFYLRNTNTTGIADIMAWYGAPGWIPVAGDWTRSGTDTIGLYDPTESVFYLKNANTSGLADIMVAYGAPGAGWLPVVGDWAGITASSLNATTVASGLAVTAALTEDQLAAVVTEAIDQWAVAGLPTSLVDALWQVEFRVSDMAGTQLGLATSSVIYVDADAAGYGWYLDLEENADGTLASLDAEAVDQIDLVSVVMHELGHTLGLGDLDGNAESLMSGTLSAGVRRLPGAAEVDAVLSGSY
jgi:hypothetical protein